jgi:hypothetical protein
LLAPYRQLSTQHLPNDLYQPKPVDFAPEHRPEGRHPGDRSNKWSVNSICLLLRKTALLAKPLLSERNTNLTKLFNLVNYFFS